MYASSGTVDYSPASSQALALANQWRLLCTSHGVSLMEAALAFAQLPCCVACVAVGVCTTEQVGVLRGGGVRGGGVRKGGLISKVMMLMGFYSCLACCA